ncbi:MAG: DUF370 domain-containing protein [Oscillospiraceae bacterium]|nr:DUF370 domain-containing protein [Oscillospiraceae bacterium]
MYLYLGEDSVAVEKDIIGIFDIENTSISKHTKDFLSESEKKKQVLNVSYDMPKSFIVCTDSDKHNAVFISHISTAVLKKRVNHSF